MEFGLRHFENLHPNSADGSATGQRNHYRQELKEHVLAHVICDKAEKAYR
jgi:hypothetical protein